MFGRTIIAGAIALCTAATTFGAGAGQVVVRDVYYTRYQHFATEANVRMRTVFFDTGTGVVTFGPITDIANTGTQAQPSVGADGILFAPNGDLLIGGQQTKRICRIDLSNPSAFTSQSVTDVIGVWMLALHPDASRVWTGPQPGSLVEVPLPFGPPTVHAVTGDETGVTQLAFVPGLPNTVFYTSSMPDGQGSFGTINLTTFQTTRVYGPDFFGAHGMRYDLYSKSLILSGDQLIVQIDPFQAGYPIVSTYDATPLGLTKEIDQVTPDMHGLIYGAGNDGTVVVIDYRNTKKVGDPANVVGSGPLEPASYLDGVTIRGIDPGACCLDSGECVVTVQADCAGVWTIGGGCVPDMCPKRGRCCGLDGSCMYVLERLCTASGSVWTKDLSCTPAPACPQPGRCCALNGSCTYVLEKLCAAPNVWTAGISCTPTNTCPMPGRCCGLDGSCVFVLRSACTATGSMWTESVPCGPPPSTCPPPGRCCALDGSCIFEFQSECTTTGSVWTVAGTCTPNTCPKPGRCCSITGTCTFVLQTLCTASGGVTWMEGVLCSAPPGCPPPGRCCALDGSCVYEPFILCTASGSIWTMGVTCATQCPPPGKCCARDGTCSYVFQENCASPSVWTSNVPCSVPCPQPGRCCASDGSCSFVLLSLCASPTVAWQQGVSCTAVPLCPKPGRCCAFDGSCTFVLQAQCTAAGGITWTEGGACSSTACPQRGRCCASDGSCSFVLQSLCSSPVVAWQELVLCTAVPVCPQRGRCCATDGGCTFVLQLQCTASGSVWTKDLNCTPAPACPQRGQCCAQDGMCSFVLQSLCVAPSTWTANITCTTQCPLPGRCCAPNGGCSIVLQSACAAGSVWSTVTSCTALPLCPQLGKCCAQDATCTYVLPSACTGFSMFTPGATCADLCPPQGRCCATDAGCTFVLQSQCTAAGSVWSMGLTCATPCPHMGRCCMPNGMCVFELQAQCMSGDWKADVACATDPKCPRPGQCCAPDATCTYVLPALCPSTSVFMQNLTCTPDACPHQGVCCSSTGMCVFEFEALCTAAGSKWTVGGSCDPNPCLGRCCANNGKCTFVLNSACPMTGGATWMLAAPCGQAQICDTPGPCCAAGGQCTFVLASQCTGRPLAPGTTCEPTNPCTACCPLGTGDFDRHTPQQSQLTVAPFVTDARTADDFYLLPQQTYRFHSITGTMLTNQTTPLFYKAKVEIYADCNGMPSGAPIKTLTKILSVMPLGTFDTDAGTLNVLKFQFDAEDLVLDGGYTYWVSFIGLGQQDQAGLEVWFWGSAGNGVIQGLPGKFKSVSGGFPEWTSVDTICCGCRDFSFCIDAEICKVVLDNTTYDPACGLPSRSGLGGPLMDVMAADQFVIPPECNVMFRRVCYIEAFLYSNCPASAVRIYTNTCQQPDAVVATLTPDRITDLGPASNDPRNVRILKLEFWPKNLQLETGMMYWLSAYGVSNGNVNQVAYFACRADCRTQCPIHFFPAAIKGRSFVAPVTQFDVWTSTADIYPPTGRDAAFLISVDTLVPLTGIEAQPCKPDVNRDGKLSVQDLFDFLTIYFTPCQ